MGRYLAVAVATLALPCLAAQEPASTPAELDSDKPALPVVLDLETAQQTALAENPSLKAAEARVSQAQAQVRQALAAFFPRVELSGGYTKTWLSKNDSAGGLGTTSLGSSGAFGTSGLGATFPGLKGTGLPSETLTTLLSQATQILQQRQQTEAALVDVLEYYRAGISASWTLFNGFERKFSYAAARSGAHETDAAYQEAQRLLLAAVATTFYTGQLARENIAIAQADEAFNLRQLEEAKARRRVGSGSLSDEFNFAVRVNAARAELIRAEQDYAVASVALAELMGVFEAALPEVFQLAPLKPEIPEEMELPEVDALIAYGGTRRPDLRQRQHTFERTDATIGVRRAPFFPMVLATASHDGFRIDDARFREEDFSSSVGLAVTYTLFAGGQNRARLTEAKAARAEARRNLESVEILLASQIRQALEDLKAVQANLHIQRENAMFVQRNRDLVEKEYRAGQASLTRLNEAQRDLIQAQGLLALARVSLRQAWHNLRTATAETLAPYTD